MQCGHDPTLHLFGSTLTHSPQANLNIKRVMQPGHNPTAAIPGHFA